MVVLLHNVSTLAMQQQPPVLRPKDVLRLALFVAQQYTRASVVLDRHHLDVLFTSILHHQGECHVPPNTVVP